MNVTVNNILIINILSKINLSKGDRQSSYYREVTVKVVLEYKVMGFIEDC